MAGPCPSGGKQLGTEVALIPRVKAGNTISPIFHHFLHLVLSKLPGPANQVSRFFSEVVSQIASFHRWATDAGGITGQYFKEDGTRKVTPSDTLPPFDRWGN